MLTASMAEAKNNLSRIAATVNATGEQVTVLKNSKPWFKIVPLAYDPEQAASDRALAEEQALLSDPDHETFDDLQDFFRAVGM